MKTMIAPLVPATWDFTRRLFARGTDAFGAKALRRTFGMPVNGHLNLPPPPFTEAEQRRARELNQYLIYQADKTADGIPFTMKRLHGQFENRLGEGKLFYDIDWYQGEDFFALDTPAIGWKLVSREVIPGSTGVDYVGQTQAIADYLTGSVYAGEELPDAYQAAVAEFESRKDELERLVHKNWKQATERLTALKLNQLFRETPVEVLYGLIVQHEVNHERLLGKTYTRTNTRSSDGDLVYVGLCDSGGVGVGVGYPGFSLSDLGVRFSRSGVGNLVS